MPLDPAPCLRPMDLDQLGVEMGFTVASEHTPVPDDSPASMSLETVALSNSQSGAAPSSVSTSLALY